MNRFSMIICFHYHSLIFTFASQWPYVTVLTRTYDRSCFPFVSWHRTKRLRSSLARAYRLWCHHCVRLWQGVLDGVSAVSSLCPSVARGCRMGCLQCHQCVRLWQEGVGWSICGAITVPVCGKGVLDVASARLSVHGK